MHTYLEIARDVEVTPDWKEYRPIKPMTFNRRFQEVAISIPECRVQVDDERLILADDTVFQPEVRIVDEGGKCYELQCAGYSISTLNIETDEMIVNGAKFKAKLPRDRSYRSIQIRSDEPIHVDEIVWHNYNLK